MVLRVSVLKHSHPRIPRGDSARYFNLGYPRMKHSVLYKFYIISGPKSRFNLHNSYKLFFKLFKYHIVFLHLLHLAF